MASKMSLRQARKDRPRSSSITAGDKGKKKAGGTPDKSNTPSTTCDMYHHEADGPKRAILNDEILALQIKAEDLLKLREPKPPVERKTTPVFNSVLVKKLRQPSESEKQKSIVVIKPAPQDSPVKVPDYSGVAGPRFDDSNNIIPHSILGDVDDFVAEAARQGELHLNSLMLADKTSGCLTVKYEKRKQPAGYPKFKSAYRSNALKNWETNMAERRRQQNYLSCVLNKPVDQLVMNQSDEYRRIQELRFLIERTVPFIEMGSSNGIGTEFWSQPTHFGGEMTGLISTLTESQKGYPPAILHVGVPQSVLAEKGLNEVSPGQPFRKPWHKAAYLRDRVMQLAPLMDELDPHEPEINDLEVIGRARPHVTAVNGLGDEAQNNGDSTSTLEKRNSSLLADNTNPLHDHSDVYPAPIVGPSIQFGGFAAQWLGSTQCNRDKVGIEARVNFEAYAGERTMSFLEIGNNGTATIYYDWRKVPKEKPFNMVDQRAQRFYFNQSNGVLLPGDLLKFPFIFKSPNAGVFSELWEFQTHPVVCGGAKLLVTLRGVALKQDKYERHRTELDDELKHKQANQVVSSLLEDLLSGIKTPERPRSPIDAYITDEELFTRRNPEVHFSRDKYVALNNLYAEALPEDDKLLPWDLRIGTVKEAILSLSEDDERKEELLQQLNDIVTSMSFKPFMPTCIVTYTACRSILSQTVDRLVQRDGVLRSFIGLPDRYQDPNAISISTPSDHRVKGKVRPDVKDKKAGKDAKAGPTKTKELLVPGRTAGGKSISAVNVNLSSSQISPIASPQVAASPSPAADDPILQAKYKNALHTQTYLVLCDMANELESVFEGLLGRNQDSPLSCH